MEALIYATLMVLVACFIPGLNGKGRAILAVGAAVVAWLVCAGTVLGLSSSYELISGRVTAKDWEYDPTYVSESCGKDCTRMKEVPRWRWDVKGDVGKHSEYTDWKREPRIYREAVIGEPFATTKHFRNAQYLAAGSVLYDHSDYSGWMPDYPRIRDGFRVDRCLSGVADCKTMNRLLAEAQRSWGPGHKVNVIVVAVAADAKGFDTALRQHWVGGKKNDAVVVVYLGAGQTISEVRAFSRSTGTVLATDGRNFNTYLRENVAAVGTWDEARIIAAIAPALPFFDREDLSKHDFWAETFQLPWYWILGQIVLLAAMFAAAAAFLRSDPSTSRTYYES